MENLSSQATDIFLTSGDNKVWTEAFRRGDYASILADVEGVLADSPKAPREKLWWVICQLEMENVPASALSTPLEELSAVLKDSPELAAQSASVCLRLSLRLADRKHYRLCVIMLEKTLEFAEKAPVFNPELCNSIKKLYASTLDTEIERAESKRESRSYIKSLEKKREELSFEQITSVAEPPERKDRVFDSRSIANGNVDLPEKVSEEDEEPIASDVSPKLRLAQILFPVLTIAGGIALIFFGVQIMNRKPAEEVVAKVANTEPEQKVETTETPSESEQAESQVEKKDSETVQKLDAVSERLGILKSLKKVANNMEAEIDTAALEKSAELRNEPPPKQPESRTPSLDPNHFKTKSRQELNSGSPFGSKKITEGQDGRRYGPGPSKKAGLRGPDGKPVEPQEVQQFDEPRPYETLNGTEVFSAPSLRAVSLARLEKGAVVHVVSKMGMWLELRSTGGRKGYIYSQDADPVEALN